VGFLVRHKCTDIVERQLIKPKGVEWARLALEYEIDARVVSGFLFFAKKLHSGAMIANPR
jgi:hypothetical protein